MRLRRALIPSGVTIATSGETDCGNRRGDREAGRGQGEAGCGHGKAGGGHGDAGRKDLGKAGCKPGDAGAEHAEAEKGTAVILVVTGDTLRGVASGDATLALPSAFVPGGRQTNAVTSG